MPNRILSSRIHVSNSISKLNPLEEVVFLHLILACDDYGRFYGDADIVKGHLFPKRPFTVRQIEDAIRKLESEDMLRRYNAEGLEYLYLTAWFTYQKPRAKESKFPDPPDADICYDLQSDDSYCEHLQADEIKPEKEKAPEFISFILNDKTYYSVSVSAVEKYKELYPAVDIEQQLRIMVGWCESNPRKRKTRAGAAQFITGWLAREQNKGGSGKQISHPRQPREIPEGENPFKGLGVIEDET